MLAGVPLVLIGAGIAVFFWLDRDAGNAPVKNGVTYEIWISEAEATPTKADGKSWDPDGSAPDLRGVIVWQDQRILETVTDTDGLIAHWQPVGLKLSEVIKGEANAATFRKVGLVRPEEGGFIEVGIFDSDPVGFDRVGVFRVPWQALKPGVNEIRDGGELSRLRLVIVEPGAERAVMPVHLVSGAERLSDTPVAMQGIVNGIGRGVGKQVESVRGKAVEKTGDAVERMKGWLNPDPQTP